MSVARPARGVPPVVEKTFAEQTLARAIAFLGDVRAADDDREDAARVIPAVLLPACPTEADLADLLSALGRALHVNLAIRRVLGALQGMRPPAVVERAGRGVERLIERTYQVGDHEALAELLLVALEDERWSLLLRDEWGKAATTWAVSQLPGRKYVASLIISGWLHVIGKVPPWLGELAEEHPDLITSGVLSAATRWQLHTAAPTAVGWHHLAGARGVPSAIDLALFVDKADLAVETLTVALGESVDQTKRATLKTWLHGLTGATP